ncbi:hypothetical protein EYF80_022042 [Liparis tanakae]|uniref:Uncharacterized protein n=1 Tax=Liparis tanakae TaxID=230148 RepID=A0A4Z2HPE8_9TELE|nr:hypothetical protein EYF80_022042 [Liparis tanakae]
MTPTDQTSTLLDILGGSLPTTKHSGGRLGGSVWAMEGGFLFNNSFLCLSMSSRCVLTRSCCLKHARTI